MRERPALERVRSAPPGAPPGQRFFDIQDRARLGGRLIPRESSQYLSPAGAGENLAQPRDRRLLKIGIQTRQEIVFFEQGNEMQAELQGGRLDTNPRINHSTGDA